MKYDASSLQRWKSDDGDNTHIINYDLNENSIIIDLGGYQGIWAELLLKKIYPLTPKIILIEPVPKFYDNLVSKFKDNNNVIVFNYGVSTDNEEQIKDLYMSNDGSSTNFNEGTLMKIKTLPIDKILSDNNIDKVDLLQINIEGDEYSLMEYMIDNNIVNKFNNIQIQYHLGIENDRERREKIRDGLILNGFKNKFDYPFVWESWYKI
jgi:FkbM family methyltransferase